MPTAKVPVRGPKPVIGSKTKASINSGKALMIFNICLVILLREFKDTLFAAKNDTGKLKIAPITVPAHAIKSDSATFGTILSIASCDKSKGNIAEIKIQILPGAEKILSGVISRPDADQIEPTTIRTVITYFNIFWLSGWFGIFIIFFFLAKH